MHLLLNEHENISGNTATAHMAHSFYTIGHATRSLDEFVDLLKVSKVTRIMDVRTIPRSRTNPQYNVDVLPKSLERFQIKYEHIASLGGLRGKNREVPACVNTFWKNESFHNYADYAMGQSFRGGLTRLIQLGKSDRCAIMCAEAVWWRCHRRIIADYLIAAGETVFHILGPGRIERAMMTSAARLHADGSLTYSNID